MQEYDSMLSIHHILKLILEWELWIYSSISKIWSNLAYACQQSNLNIRCCLTMRYRVKIQYWYVSLCRRINQNNLVFFIIYKGIHTLNVRSANSTMSLHKNVNINASLLFIVAYSVNRQMFSTWKYANLKSEMLKKVMNLDIKTEMD